MRSWLDGSIQYLDLSRILAQFLPILSKTWGVAWKNQITCHALDDVDWSREAFISRYGPTMGNLRYLMNRSNLLDDGEGATSRWCTKICARKDSGEFFGRWGGVRVQPVLCLRLLATSQFAMFSCWKCVLWRTHSDHGRGWAWSTFGGISEGPDQLGHEVLGLNLLKVFFWRTPS